MSEGCATLLYVSESAIERSSETAMLDDIVAVARSRNAALKVTGALIFTQAHFAQILEGVRPAIDELMVSIHRDIRHRNVDVLEYAEISERRFPEWNMAYSGASRYIDRYLAPLLQPQAAGTRQMMIRQLIRMMHEFSHG